MGTVLKRLKRAWARLRNQRGAGVSEGTLSGAKKETLTTVTVPWRSSTSWDEYNLRVYPHHDVDRFQFYAEIGDRISVRAEVSLPGRGVRVRVFSGEEGETPAHASSDEHGVVELFVVARVSGMHWVEVGLDAPKSERPRSYRLSIDAPRLRRPADGTRPKEAEFVDVPVGHHYREAVLAVVAAGVMTGSEEWWQFAPDSPVTRVELAEMVRDSLGSEGSGAVPVLLADLATQDRLKGALRVVPRDLGRPGPQVVATTSGGSSAVSPGARPPIAAIARAQAVSLIVRALERYRPGVLEGPPRGFLCTMASSVHSLHVRIAEYNGLMEGLEGFGPQWDPRLAVSRGEVAHMLWMTMQLKMKRTDAETPRGVALPTPSPLAEGGVAPDLTALGVHTSEYLLGAQEEIDRLMAESEPADGSPPSTEALPRIDLLAPDRAEMRQKIAQTLDRLRAKTEDSVGPTREDAPGREPDEPTDH